VTDWIEVGELCVEYCPTGEINYWWTSLQSCCREQQVSKKFQDCILNVSEQALKQQAADNMDDECQASKPLHHRSVMRNNDEQNRQSEKMEVRIAEGSKKVKRAMSPNKDGL
jgi:hypothetical protein